MKNKYLTTTTIITNFFVLVIIYYKVCDIIIKMHILSKPSIKVTQKKKKKNHNVICNKHVHRPLIFHEK